MNLFEAIDISRLKEPLDDIDFDLNLPLIIGLSIGLGVVFLLLLGLTIYFSFFNNGQGSIFLGSNFNVPGEFDDEETLLNDERTYLANFTSLEKDNYFDGKNFQLDHVPVTNPLGSTLTESEKTYIRDRGIQAYIFEQPSELVKIGHAPAVSIEDKLDVRFVNSTDDEPTSVILNYPLPIKVNDSNNDTIYFEVKIFELEPETKISIGLSSRPYPLFRLPGYNKYSIAYESDGTVRINQPFYSPSIWNKLIEGDVLGVGFKPRSGTIFFTHNGKKVLEAAHNVKFDLYPIIGTVGPAKLDTNIGQLGFVFIEANVKKWGFGSVYGTIGVPPAYGKEINKDAVLDKGEELPPNYPSEEDTFFGPTALLTRNVNVGSASQDIESSKPTKILNKPPSYNDEPKEELISNNTPIRVDEDTERLYERRSSTFDLQNNDYEVLIGSALPIPKDPLHALHNEPQTTTEVTKANIQDDTHQEDEQPLKSLPQPQTQEIETVKKTELPIAEQTPSASQSQHIEGTIQNSISPESSPEPESTPEPQAEDTNPATSTKSTSNKNKKKKKKKNNKKKGKN